MVIHADIHAFSPSKPLSFIIVMTTFSIGALEMVIKIFKSRPYSFQFQSADQNENFDKNKKDIGITSKIKKNLNLNGMILKNVK